MEEESAASLLIPFWSATQYIDLRRTQVLCIGWGCRNRQNSRPWPVNARQLFLDELVSVGLFIISLKCMPAETWAHFGLHCNLGETYYIILIMLQTQTTWIFRPFITFFLLTFHFICNSRFVIYSLVLISETKDGKVLKLKLKVQKEGKFWSR